jgi:hypothetical protein
LAARKARNVAIPDTTSRPFPRKVEGTSGGVIHTHSTEPTAAPQCSYFVPSSSARAKFEQRPPGPKIRSPVLRKRISTAQPCCRSRPGSGAPAAARGRGSKRGSGFVYGWLTNSLQSSASHDGRKRPHACTFRFHINDLTRGNRWRFSRRRNRITAISRQVRRFNCAPLLPLGHIFFAANQLVLRTTGREANFALTTAQSSASNAVGELA